MSVMSVNESDAGAKRKMTALEAIKEEIEAKKAKKEQLARTDNWITEVWCGMVWYLIVFQLSQ